MLKVFFYSVLLISGLLLSGLPRHPMVSEFVRMATTFALAFIMIHVGYEFEMNKSRLKGYAKDIAVAFTAAGLPWIFCALYFVLVLGPRDRWGDWEAWKPALVQAAFASPTSAGVLFTMLAAAGLGATWVFGKARLLAIFDDLGTILLLIPLKAIVVGLHWQLGVVVLTLFALLWIGYRYLNTLRIPATWPFVMIYAAVLAAGVESLHHYDKLLAVEVLLPAFVLGCLIKPPPSADPHHNDASNESNEIAPAKRILDYFGDIPNQDSTEGADIAPKSNSEQNVAMLISSCFMVLVGMSMPPVDTAQPDFPGWGMIAVHVLIVTIISNLGKMVPAMCYRNETTLHNRLALAVAMFPRGEVGAGVLVISLSYGFGGTALTVAILSLVLNLLLTGPFIWIVKKWVTDGTPPPNATQNV